MSLDIDTLIARQPHPWRINVAPPRDRFFEIQYLGTCLIAVYQPLNECWTVGTDIRIERDEITHWRDLSAQQLDDLNHRLAGNV